MTIRFAAARKWGWPNLPGLGAHAMPLSPANDNGMPEISVDMLGEALRHFARHGLSAAEQARGEALRAKRAGDDPSYNWWLGVCRTLDRRMADGLARRIASGPVQ